MSELYQQVISLAFAHPWNDNLWRQIRLKSTLALHPQVFEDHTENFSATRQIVKSYGKPKTTQDDWIEQEFSAIILFNPTEYSSMVNWKTAWSRILIAVAEGADLFVLPGPKDDKEWGKCLLPTQFEMCAATHPCDIPLNMMAGSSRSYSPHSVKVFLRNQLPRRTLEFHWTKDLRVRHFPTGSGRHKARPSQRDREPAPRHRSRSPERLVEHPTKYAHRRFDPYRDEQRPFGQRHRSHDYPSSSYRNSSYNPSHSYAHHSYAHPSGSR
ncbi:hypothetical protein Aduo_001395 [Ancylostoma duodenale]